MAKGNNKVQIEVDFRIARALQRINVLKDSMGKCVSKANKMNTSTDKLKTNTKETSKETKKIKNDLKSSDIYAKSMAESATIISKAFVGIALGNQFIEAAETYSSAINKLNNVNYMNNPKASKEAIDQMSQTQLDKMYNSAQSAKMGYGDLMGNVGKQALLAGDAFDNNMDNVIKFNELMGKAYAISGATAEEQSASMMQLTQALASGVMQGDELKSVREGASLAYQTIEDYAQEVYDTDESLKELGSQGKVTSDLIVAAILENEKQLNAAMGRSEITVGQFWTMFKNDIFKAFEPAFAELQKFLGTLVDSPFAEVFKNIITAIGKSLAFVIHLANYLLELSIKYKNVVTPILYTIGFLLVGIVAKGLIIVQKETILAVLKFLQLDKVVAAIPLKFKLLFAAITIVSILLDRASDHTKKMSTIMIVSISKVAMALLALKVIVSLVTGHIFRAFAIVGVIALLQFLQKSIYLRDSIISGVAHVVGTIASAIAQVIAFFQYCWQACGQTFEAFKNFCGDECNNILQFFKNLVHNVKAIWDEMVAYCANKLGGLLSSIVNSKGFSKIAKKAHIDVGAIRETANNLKNKTAASSTIDMATGMVDSMANFENYIKNNPIDIDIGAAGDAAYSNWYNKILNIGNGISNKVGDLAKPFGGGVGVDAPGVDYSSPDVSDALGNIGETADNTDKINDQLSMVSEDLSYLKDLAELEWKKEFTTANINVSMTNNNTLDNKSDLGNFATQLREVLVGEMKTVAAGTYS